MRTVFSSLFVGVTLLLAASCTVASDPGSPGAGGSSGAMAGTTASTGGGGAGAIINGGSGTVGGSNNTSGGSATAGSGSGGMSGGTAGASAGAGTSGAGGSGGSDAHVPKPSAGCGKANPAMGSRTITTGGQSSMFNVNLPANYDATKPMPLGFGFHGFGNGACGPTQGECRGFAMLPAVTVYMKSISDGWEQGAVLEQNIKYWQDVLALMKNEYCIDESRIFIAGVSSGGQFIEHLTCRFGDTLWQTTAVCAGVVGSATNNCKGTPPILVIHGVTDQAGGYGKDVAALFAKRNGCSETAPAGLQQAMTEMNAARTAEEDKHVCLDWDGCTLNPVRFCISSQITYDDVTHGWPKIGGTLISEFHGTID